MSSGLVQGTDRRASTTIKVIPARSLTSEIETPSLPMNIVVGPVTAKYDASSFAVDPDGSR
jgi:hypothetical protein